MKTQLVSIIMPVYNGADRISKAIRSVFKQSYKNWELLIVDDGSSDNTKEIIESLAKNDHRIRYIKNLANLGIQKTLNKGLMEAKGDYIARIDDDDIWIDINKLQIQVEFFNKNPEYVLVGTGAILSDESERELSRFLMPNQDSDIRNKILSKNCFIHSSVMFNKNTALDFRGYDESKDVRHIEDYDLWLKIGTKGKFFNFPTYSVSLQQSANTISAQNRVAQALRGIKEVRKFKTLYPKFARGYFISVFRLMFFILHKILPLDNKLIYKIKTIYKQ